MSEKKGESRHILKMLAAAIKLGRPLIYINLFSSLILITGSYIRSLFIGLLSSRTVGAMMSGEPVLNAALSCYVLLLVGAGLLMLGHFINTYAGSKTNVSISMRLLSAALERTEESCRGSHTSEFLGRLTGDMYRLGEFYRQQFRSNVLHPVLMGVLGIITLVTVDWRLMIVSVVLGSLSSFVTSKFSPAVQKLARQGRTDYDKYSKTFSEALQGDMSIRLMSFTDAIYEENAADAARLAETNVRADILGNRISLVSGCFSALSLVSFLGIGAFLSSRGQMNFADILLCLPMQGLVTTMFGSFGGAWNYITSVSASTERILEVMDAPTEDRREGASAKPAAGSRYIVEFDGVTFSYGGDRLILDGFSLGVGEGETVAFVSPSGGGKSTLLQLLLGFYAPSSGDIRVGGVSFRDCPLDVWRGNFVYVQQEAPLFDMTVGENIALGAYGEGRAVTREEIERAAARAGAHDFITELDKGYDTPVGELGGRLSGGQRQRIAIARAFISDAPILILDEPTSALDTQSEALIQAALDALMENRTVLVVAHRLSTVQNADRIVVLENGRISESGTHGKLMKTGGYYSAVSALSQSSFAQRADAGVIN